VQTQSAHGVKAPSPLTPLQPASTAQFGLQPQNTHTHTHPLSPLPHPTHLSSQPQHTHSPFPPHAGLLRKLDECIAFVASHPQYADAGAYTTRFRQLQGRALGAVRNKVQQVFKHAVQQVGGWGRAGIQVCAMGAVRNKVQQVPKHGVQQVGRRGLERSARAVRARACHPSSAGCAGPAAPAQGSKQPASWLDVPLSQGV